MWSRKQPKEDVGESSRLSDTRRLLGPQREMKPKDQGLKGPGAGEDVRRGMSWTE